jgi:hypothetical protein
VNARAVLATLGIILIALFLGITVLAHVHGLVPTGVETVNSQLARRVFGGGPFYYLVQGVTTLILVLAANTSFADFPRPASPAQPDGPPDQGRPALSAGRRRDQRAVSSQGMTEGRPAVRRPVGRVAGARDPIAARPRHVSPPRRA